MAGRVTAHEYDGTHYYQRAYDDDDADKRKRSTIESVERAIDR